MTILIELNQFRKPGLGGSRFTRALEYARAKNSSSHPIISWIEAAGINKPTLIFDMSVIRERMLWLAALTKSFSATPLLAVKSCTDNAFLHVANNYLGGFDVSNLTEYLALPADLQDRLVSVTSPAALENQDSFRGKGNELIITVDSQLQLDRHLAQAQPSEYLLRVQGSSLLEAAKPADPAYYPITRFGFTVDEVVRLLKAPWMKNNLPVGFQVHHGSETNKLSTYKTIIQGLVRLAGLLEHSANYINLGGGWHCLSQQEFSDVLCDARKYFPEPCSILLEPGRWYAKSAGFAVGSIVNISRAGEIVRCTLDLSAKSHLRWSNPKLLHMFEPQHDRKCVVQFYGPSCYESDLIGKYYLPYSTDVLKDSGLSYGKKVVFSNVSTYSREWNTSFNGVPLADVEWINI